MDKKSRIKKTRWTKQIAMMHVEGCKQSGLSKIDYSKKEGVDYGRLVWWSRRLQTNKVQPEGNIAFLPVALRPQRDAVPERIEIVLSGGRIIRVGKHFEPTTLRAVVQALEATC